MRFEKNSENSRASVQDGRLSLTAGTTSVFLGYEKIRKNGYCGTSARSSDSRLFGLSHAYAFHLSSLDQNERKVVNLCVGFLSIQGNKCIQTTGKPPLLVMDFLKIAR